MDANTFGLMSAGFANALMPSNLIMMIIGVTIGIVVGCMPGLSAAMGVALLLPLTFGMAPETGLIMLGGIYCGAIFGGSISAILIHTPGTPASAATALDGYELTKQGKAGKALGTACIASFFGGLLSCISLYFFAPMLAELAMNNGINVTCALIGLFSLSQVFILAEKAIKERGSIVKFHDSVMLKFHELKQIGPTVIRSWLIGNIIGILPGAGASIACFLGYNTAKQFSKKPEDFGRGSIEGVAGSEAANNAVTGGSLIPTLTLGIPGESVTAVLMGGLIIQGLQPGPELFTKYAPMTYTFFAGFVIVQFFMLLIGLGGCRIFAHISKLSDAVLIPCIFVLCVVGSFAINNSFVDVVIMFIFGIMGYLMRKLGLNTAAVVLALILGPIGERGLRRSLTLSGNDITILFSTPICWVLITLCILSSFSPLLMDWLKKGKQAIKGK